MGCLCSSDVYCSSPFASVHSLTTVKTLTIEMWKCDHVSDEEEEGEGKEEEGKEEGKRGKRRGRGEGGG